MKLLYRRTFKICNGPFMKEIPWIEKERSFIAPTTFTNAYKMFVDIIEVRVVLLYNLLSWACNTYFSRIFYNFICVMRA